MPRIVPDLLDRYNSSKNGDKKHPPYAFEFYPPRTDEAVQKLYQRLESMAKLEPLYVDFTWGAGGSTSDLTLELAVQAKKRYGLEPNMHLTCTNMPEKLIDEALEGAKAGGIQNIVALRGDPPKGSEEWKKTDGGFSCALDLVRHIRKKYGQHFCVSVAGYPEGHPTVIKPVEDVSKLSKTEKTRLVTSEDGNQFVCSDADFKKEIAYLKRKVDAGADMIITQMFFDTAVFVAFVAECRDAGIKVPIVPGLMLIQAYGGFKRMTKFCKSAVPASLRAELEEANKEKGGVKALGTKIGVETSKVLIKQNLAPVLHYYTLNMERVVTDVLKDLDFLPASTGSSSSMPARDSKMSETVENLAVRMHTGTILSASHEEIKGGSNTVASKATN